MLATVYCDPMEWLNYHHLLYFRTVATEGGIARACEKLNLAQPAISGQLKQLEETPGRKSVRQESPWFDMTVVVKSSIVMPKTSSAADENCRTRQRANPRAALSGC